MTTQHKLHRFCGANLDDRPSLKKLRPLADVLKYRNSAVIEKFREAYALPRRDAEALFTEMKRWLWLNARANSLPGSPDVYVFAEMTAIDEMWHTFVLFTKDYQAFCYRYFGHFVHHVPNIDRRFVRSRKNDPEVERKLWETGVRFVVEQLGPEIALRWFKTFPKRYSLAILDKRRRTHQAMVGAQ